MEQVTQTDAKRFSLVKRAKSFTHAGRGLWIFLKTTHNAWIHVAVFVLAIALGIFFNISHIEWMILALMGGVVIAAEAFNTAIEIDMNLTSPEYHPYTRDTKDVAAGAVLVVALTALAVGVLIFGPYVALIA